ncbi:hypothetical protein [Citrobacter portucalensis]|uniref:hypothetical protein n=1 Tax=Citrobacter portucalensis TaxID=1639133 RepID=UPI00358DBFBB
MQRRLKRRNAGLPCSEVTYPTTLSFTAFDLSGATLCSSVDTTYGWVGSAAAISHTTDTTVTPPGCYAATEEGQLQGVGWSHTSGVKSYKQRVLIRSRSELPN